MGIIRKLLHYIFGFEYVLFYYRDRYGEFFSKVLRVTELSEDYYVRWHDAHICLIPKGKVEEGQYTWKPITPWTSEFYRGEDSER